MADDRSRSDDADGTADASRSDTESDGEYDPFSYDPFSEEGDEDEDERDANDRSGSGGEGVAGGAGADGAATDGANAASNGPPGSDGGGADVRTVEVPTHVYKRVTVFSTLFAVVTVVGGFLLLDTATDRATRPLSEADPLLALAGLGLIALGAVTYAYSTRFQAEGMGNAKDESDEDSSNG